MRSKPRSSPLGPLCAVLSSHPSTTGKIHSMPRGIWRADHGSSAVFKLTGLLRLQPRNTESEADTSQLAATFICTVCDLLGDHSPYRAVHKALFGCAEPSGSTSSNAVQSRRRPDTIVIMNECTLMLTKDKVADIKLAMEDLRSKRVELNALHHGPMSFLPAYAAAGTRMQWLWMSSDGEQVSTCCPGFKAHMKTASGSRHAMIMPLLSTSSPSNQPPSCTSTHAVFHRKSVGQADAGPLPAGLALNGCNCDTLSKPREYTTSSDMH